MQNISAPCRNKIWCNDKSFLEQQEELKLAEAKADNASFKAAAHIHIQFDAPIVPERDKPKRQFAPQTIPDWVCQGLRPKGLRDEDIVKVPKRSIGGWKRGSICPPPGADEFIPSSSTSPRKDELHDQPKRKKACTRGTQTLYRESSAQTLPYLPDPYADQKQNLDDIELYHMPTMVEHDGPPGRRALEQYVRGRKRWLFTRDLKVEFERMLLDAREVIISQPPIYTKAMHIFEWEKWIEREQYIQQCQLLRLELVIRMLEKREKEMFDTSMERIEKSFENIEARRVASLEKNEKEYQREVRRTYRRHHEISTKWHAEDVVTELFDPAADFNAPQLRYGVNLRRKHLKLHTLSERIDRIEMHPVDMKNLSCPFAKMKEIAKPKERMREIVTNFCDEKNLQDMYNELKTLRLRSEQKVTGNPKCVYPKQRRSLTPEPSFENAFVFTPIPILSRPKAEKVPKKEEVVVPPPIEPIPKKVPTEEILEDGKFPRMKRKLENPLKLTHAEMRREELEALLAEFEGTTIGWMMRFLSDEASRMREQRKLHLVTVLAKKERWRREALEAGLRQKENTFRIIYEHILKDAHPLIRDNIDHILSDVGKSTTLNYIDEMAAARVKRLAVAIDEDIENWFKLVYNMSEPFNDALLSYVLQDANFPNLTQTLKRREAELVTSFILSDVLMPHVFHLLDPLDISNYTAEEIVDRLIDTDLHLFSPEESSISSCEQCDESGCICSPKAREARAIVRKLLRYSVPGRRWKTSTERICFENVRDILDDAFEQMEREGILYEGKEYSKPLTLLPSLMDINKEQSLPELQEQESIYKNERLICKQDLYRFKPVNIDITKKLDREEQMIVNDSSESSSFSGESIIMTILSYKNPPKPTESLEFSPGQLRDILSSHDISHGIFDPKALRPKPPPFGGSQPTSDSEYSEINVLFDTGGTRSDINKGFVTFLIKKIIDKFIPREDGEDSDEEVKKQLPDVGHNLPAKKSEEKLAGEKLAQRHSSSSIQIEDRPLIITESELKRMDEEHCKCEKELKIDRAIRQKLAEGKVVVIPSTKPTADNDDDDDSSISCGGIEPFLYHTASMGDYLSGSNEDDSDAKESNEEDEEVEEIDDAEENVTAQAPADVPADEGESQAQIADETPLEDKQMEKELQIATSAEAQVLDEIATEEPDNINIETEVAAGAGNAEEPEVKPNEEDKTADNGTAMKENEIEIDAVAPEIEALVDLADGAIPENE